MLESVPGPLLCAVQVFERTDEASLAAVGDRFEEWSLRSYRLNRPGANHGVLLGTCRWTIRQ